MAKQKKAEEELKEFLKKKGASLVGKYLSAKDKIQVKCKCGHVIITKSNEIKRRTGDFIYCEPCGARGRLEYTAEDWEDSALRLGLQVTDMSIGEWVELKGSCGHDVPRMSFGSFKKRLYRESSLCEECSVMKTAGERVDSFEDMALKGGATITNLDLSENRTVSIMYKCGHHGECGTRSISFKMKKYNVQDK